MTDCSFQLKGSVFTAVVLELKRYDKVAFGRDLEQKIEQAPQLLQQSPVVFKLDKYEGAPQSLDLTDLVTRCRSLGLQPIGFRSCPGFDAAIRDAGLPILPASTAGGNSAALDATLRVTSETPAASGRPVAAPAARVPSKVITQPVRSGQQIYARDCDLIVMSQVSEGAEVLADGNIHVYGGLRGRALAGVQGDTSARIFCHSVEAELLSVAGNFVLSEDYRDKLWKEPVQAYLEQDRLCIDPL